MSSVDILKGKLKAQNREIWAVGGGKGGTGKTFLSGNLAISLTRLGKKVILIDADLGCANLHTCLGISVKGATLSDFIRGKVKSIHEVLLETQIPNLSLISGAQDFLEIANPKYREKMKLIRQIQELDFEYIILDLGAGTSFNILDFFLISDVGILTVLPEPTSIENVYRFIKSSFYRRFKKVVKDPAIKAVITQAMDQKNDLGIRTPFDLIEQVEKIDFEVGRTLKEQIYNFKPKIIVNQVRSKDDIALGFSMRSSCSKYFGIQIEYVGYVEYDDSVWRATKMSRPLMLEYPYSTSAQGINRISHNLLKKEQLSFDFLVQ
ncbi:MAG: AAA family ATPase [Nitrospirae bacterium]|nr:AAA family ATPase [Nitrospirota bacterium]MBI3352332.1 AAA family ATPase [Nitrospirota bacterium]